MPPSPVGASRLLREWAARFWTHARLAPACASVAIGGANRRPGLFNAAPTKNNHIDAAGGIPQAVENCRPSGRAVEVEVRDAEELEETLSCGIRHVLLDNFSPQQVAQAVERVAGRAKLEVSGNDLLETVRDYAEAGADFISVGALTHSAPAADISFRLE